MYTEKQKASNHEYYLKNRTRIATRLREYAKAHPEGCRERQRRYRLAHPDRIRDSRLKQSRKEQGILGVGAERRIGVCPICGIENNLVPDHNHTTGQLRKWLCASCNLQLGQFEKLEALGLNNKFRQYLQEFC